MLLQQKLQTGTFLEVQWLRLHTPNAGGTGSIPGRGSKIPHAMRCGQKKKKAEASNKGHCTGLGTRWRWGWKGTEVKGLVRARGAMGRPWRLKERLPGTW